jgi:nucleoside-diphosphate-sugar epimerase
MPIPPPSLRSPSPLPFPRESIDDFLSHPTAGVVATVTRTPGPFLVLGAAGKLGLHLCIMLRTALDQLGRTDRVIAVSRFTTLRDRAAFESRRIETCPCDLADPAALAALPAAPTVFFLAGVKFGTATAPDLLHAVNVEVPARVAAHFHASRIVAFSSGCVYPFVTAASGGASEAMPPAPVGDYAASCLAREQAFSAAGRLHGNPIALIRLNYSVEFRYGLLVDIAESVLAGRPVDITTGYVNVIWQPDALAHSIQALDLAGTPAVPVNVTGPQTLSVRELAVNFGTLLGRPAVITGTEADTAWLNDAGLSHVRFGLPATSVDQMMTWIATWLLKHGETWGKPTGFERRDGRF